MHTQSSLVKSKGSYGVRAALFGIIAVLFQVAPHQLGLVFMLGAVGNLYRVERIGNDPDRSAVAKGVFCGVLMYIAVDNYKSKGSMLGTFICVPVFILAGFEHSIADMFYFSSAMMWNMDSFLFTLAILFGNMIGCCLIPAYRLYVNGEEKA